MAATGVKVEGADRLAATLRRAADDLNDLSKAHRNAGNRVASAARLRARRRTGRLASSFTVTVADDGVAVSSSVSYAGIQEFGSRYVRPSRALTGALADETAGITDIYMAAVTKAVNGVQGK